MPTPDPLVDLHHVTKAFGRHVVLREVSLTLLPSEVHVLAGENGAGKSSLIKILGGVHTDWSGRLLLAGTEHRFANPIEALHAGIAIIHQELSLIGPLSVADNLFLGREHRTRFGGVDQARQRREARALLEDLGVDADVDAPVERLPLGSRQLVEIARALAADARVLVLDEPTSALTEPEADRLFEHIDTLRARGVGVLYVTHRMAEIERLADRITVLRDGAVVGTWAKDALSPAALVQAMAGRPVRELFPQRREQPGGAALEVVGLTVRGHRGERPPVDGVSLSVREGEIVGLAGLAGSGASALLHALFGDAATRRDGATRLHGEAILVRSPAAAIASGIVLLTHDRQTSGLVPELSVQANMTLASLAQWSPRGVLRGRLEHEASTAMAQRLRLVAPSLDAPVRTLSGGNQQKVLVARWLLCRPQVLLLDEPTRGVDVAARADLYDLIRQEAGRGVAVLVHSSELDELTGLCDRIVVLRRGRVAAELAGGDATPEAILAAAMGAGAA